MILSEVSFVLSQFLHANSGMATQVKSASFHILLRHYYPVIVPFHDIYSDTQTASLNKHYISYKRNDRPSVVTGTLWTLPRALVWNFWYSNCVVGSARAIINILENTHSFESKISVIMSVNILLKRVSDLNN